MQSHNGESPNHCTLRALLKAEAERIDKLKAAVDAYGTKQLRRDENLYANNPCIVEAIQSTIAACNDQLRILNNIGGAITRYTSLLRDAEAPLQTIQSEFNRVVSSIDTKYKKILGDFQRLLPTDLQSRRRGLMQAKIEEELKCIADNIKKLGTEAKLEDVLGRRINDLRMGRADDEFLLKPADDENQCIASKNIELLETYYAEIDTEAGKSYAGRNELIKSTKAAANAIQLPENYGEKVMLAAKTIREKMQLIPSISSELYLNEAEASNTCGRILSLWDGGCRTFGAGTALQEVISSQLRLDMRNLRKSYVTKQAEMLGLYGLGSEKEQRALLQSLKKETGFHATLEAQERERLVFVKGGRRTQSDRTSIQMTNFAAQGNAPQDRTPLLPTPLNQRHHYVPIQQQNVRSQQQSTYHFPKENVWTRHKGIFIGAGVGLLMAGFIVASAFLIGTPIIVAGVVSGIVAAISFGMGIARDIATRSSKAKALAEKRTADKAAADKAAADKVAAERAAAERVAAEERAAAERVAAERAAAEKVAAAERAAADKAAAEERAAAERVAAEDIARALREARVLRETAERARVSEPVAPESSGAEKEHASRVAFLNTIDPVDEPEVEAVGPLFDLVIPPSPSSPPEAPAASAAPAPAAPSAAPAVRKARAAEISPMPPGGMNRVLPASLTPADGPATSIGLFSMFGKTRKAAVVAANRTKEAALWLKKTLDVQPSAQPTAQPPRVRTPSPPPSSQVQPLATAQPLATVQSPTTAEPPVRTPSPPL